MTALRKWWNRRLYAQVRAARREAKHYQESLKVALFRLETEKARNRELHRRLASYEKSPV